MVHDNILSHFCIISPLFSRSFWDVLSPYFWVLHHRLMSNLLEGGVKTEGQKSDEIMVM